MESGSTGFPEDQRDTGADSQSDVYGIIADIDTLEEMIEDLDELGLTTRDEIVAALDQLHQRVGDRVADAKISRLEALLEAMDDFEATSREDLVAKMVNYDAEVDDYDAGNDPDDQSE